MIPILLVDINLCIKHFFLMKPKAKREARD